MEKKSPEGLSPVVGWPAGRDLREPDTTWGDLWEKKNRKECAGRFLGGKGMVTKRNRKPAAGKLKNWKHLCDGGYGKKAKRGTAVSKLPAPTEPQFRRRGKEASAGAGKGFGRTKLSGVKWVAHP